MPLSYDDFIKNIKGLTEEDRKIIRDFKRLDKDVQINQEKANRNDANNLDKDEYRKVLLETTHLATFRNQTDTQFMVSELENIKSDNSPESRELYEKSRNNANYFFSKITNNNILENYLDYAQHKNDVKDVNNVEAYFKFADLMKRMFGLENLDVDAQRKRYEDHLDAIRKEAAKAENKTAAKLIIKADRSYKNAKLTLRGSQQYDDIGIAYGAAFVQLQDTEKKLEQLRDNSSIKDKRAAMLSLKESIEKLGNIKKAAEAYYEYKKTDGKNQWADDPSQIKNKNARARRLAAMDMEKFADHAKKMYSRMYDELEAEVNKQLKYDIPVQGNSRIKFEDFGIHSDFDNSLDIIASDELNDNNSIQVSDKEDPAFTMAVAEDRKAISDNLAVLHSNKKFGAENLTEIRNGLAGIIAANLLRGKMDPDSPGYALEKSIHQREIATDLTHIMNFERLGGANEFIKFANGAFSANGTALTLDYAKRKASVKIPEKIDDPTKVDKIVNTVKKGRKI